jgi:predicted esterase
MSGPVAGASAAEFEAQEHRLAVRRRARYFTLGRPGPRIRELWIVCHGYGQLARRFLRSMSPLDDGRRLVVAPEALNRFYLPDPSGSMLHQNAKVGATWMTREDRLAEIEDYVEYLDAVHRDAVRQLDAAVALHVLGFSQGTATATRWLARGETRADRLVLWAGPLPDEVDLAAAQAGRRWRRVTFVVGLQDEFATAAVVATQETRLREAGIPFELLRFEGGHAIDGETLRRVAGREASGV